MALEIGKNPLLRFPVCHFANMFTLVKVSARKKKF